MKQLKHLRQTLWRALLCLTVLVGFAAPGWAYDTYSVNYNTGNGWQQPILVKQANGNYTCQITTTSDSNQLEIKANNDYFACSRNASDKNISTTGWNALTQNDRTHYIVKTAGTYTIELEVESDSKPKQFKMYSASQGGDVSSAPSNLYLFGIGNEWDASSPIDMGAPNNGVFTKSVTLKQESSFSFAENKGSNNDDWTTVNSGLRYGPVSDDAKDGSETLTLTNNVVTSNVKAWAAGTGDSSTWKLAAGEYVFKVDFSKSPAVFTVTTAGSGGDVTTSEYDYYFMRSRDWNNPEKLEFKDGVATLTRNMNANGQFGISVNKQSDGSQEGWYIIANDGKAIAAGTNKYTLVKGNNVNIILPNKGGNYTFVITLGDDKLPKDITITTPEIEAELPALYIGGSYKGGNWDNPAQIPGNASTGKYGDYKIVVPEAGKQFRFYDKDKNKIGANTGNNSNWTIIPNDHCNGLYELTAVARDQVYEFKEVGTYTISINEYNESAKTVKFTMTYQEPQKHLYLGADFKGNLTSPDFQLDNDDKFTKVRFTKYSNDGGMFRFSNREFGTADNHWIGPSTNEDIHLSMSNNQGAYTIGKSNQVYTVKNNGVYELQVTSWNDFEVKFTLTYIEEVENDTPYYFVGDMNDWYSLEFEDPTAPKEVNMGKFLAERDAWKFRKVKDTDEKPEGVDTDWYVFDGFPGKQLSGQFQISSGGSVNIWTNADVYGHGTSMTADNWNKKDDNDNDPNHQDNHWRIKEYHKTRITDDMITGNIKFSEKGLGIQKRPVGTGGTFPNFHMECNAVADAKIYFKPGDNPDIIISGRPRHFFVFYANTKNDGGDDEVIAKINEGKPNTNNYFLPGVKFGNDKIPNYTMNSCGNAANKHMYSEEGAKLIKVEKFKRNDYSPEEIYTYLTGLGIDDVVADKIANEGVLPNGRLVGSFEHLYIARIPAGFENPAGWKYTLSLPKAFSRDDLQKPVAIACNHIYFMPTINGVSVHVNDDEFMTDKYYVEDDETGEKTPMSEFDVQYYYRVYYSTPSADGNSYEIKIAKHMPGNIIEEEHTAYKSGVDARKPTLQETGRNLEFGWKPLNAYASPEEVNATISQEMLDKGDKWKIEEGNLSGKVEEDRKWHICWVQSSDRMRRQRIPKELSNAYIQILACYFKKDNADNPMRMKAARAAEGSEIATTEAPDMTVALDKADHVSIEPGELSFDNDKFHHPLQGNHLYYVLDNNAAVWTGIESIEDDFIGNTVEGDVNATPVYYTLEVVVYWSCVDVTFCVSNHVILDVLYTCPYILVGSEHTEEVVSLQRVVILVIVEVERTGSIADDCAIVASLVKYVLEVYVGIGGSCAAGSRLLGILRSEDAQNLNVRHVVAVRNEQTGHLCLLLHKVHVPHLAILEVAVVFNGIVPSVTLGFGCHGVQFLPSISIGIAHSPITGLVIINESLLALLACILGIVDLLVAPLSNHIVGIVIHHMD